MLYEQELTKAAIFQPYAVENLMRAYNSQQRFVHYTTAENAMKILTNREIWLRKPICMNDYSEVQHGLECLYSAWNSEAGNKLKIFLENTKKGMVEKVQDLFNHWTHDIEYQSYVACVSEHQNHEEKNGRLSMWRAYGGKSGIALVINGKPFFRTESQLNVFSTPVAYQNAEQFQNSFEAICHGIISAENLIQMMPPEEIQNRLFSMMCFAALGTKHPGFEEEKEWRIICAPNIWQASTVKKSIEIINQEPQAVYKLPLQNNPEIGVDWLEIDQILDRIIIGPTENSFIVYEAMVETLSEIGVQNAEHRIAVSDIPLR